MLTINLKFQIRFITLHNLHGDPLPVFAHHPYRMVRHLFLYQDFRTSVKLLYIYILFLSFSVFNYNESPF